MSRQSYRASIAVLLVASVVVIVLVTMLVVDLTQSSSPQPVTNKQAQTTIQPNGQTAVTYWLFFANGQRASVPASTYNKVQVGGAYDSSNGTVETPSQVEASHSSPSSGDSGGSSADSGGNAVHDSAPVDSAPVEHASPPVEVPDVAVK